MRNFPDNILDPENMPFAGNFSDAVFPVTPETCRFYMGEKCYDDAVAGTEQLFCHKHGIQYLLYWLEKDAAETRPDYKMDAGDKADYLSELAKYTAASILEDLHYVRCQMQFCKS